MFDQQAVTLIDRKAWKLKLIYIDVINVALFTNRCFQFQLKYILHVERSKL